MMATSFTCDDRRHIVGTQHARHGLANLGMNHVLADRNSGPALCIRVVLLACNLLFVAAGQQPFGCILARIHLHAVL